MGELRKVGSRATRLLGLLNFDLLTKRLSLDFDDVTKNGFTLIISLEISDRQWKSIFYQFNYARSFCTNFSYWIN